MQWKEEDMAEALSVLRNSGTLLYPTDTIWGIGCDATDALAVDKIYALKKRTDKKAMIILLADERDIMQWIAAPDPEIFDYLDKLQKPTTIIFEGALGLPDNLIAENGSIAIRLVKDPFCKHLIKRLGRPIVSTSANISGYPYPVNFQAIDKDIRAGVDHVVQYRQQELALHKPSALVQWRNGEEPLVIRE